MKNFENKVIINYEKIIPEDEEIRDGFKVSSNRKKVRNVQLGLFKELKKICEKYNINYYADGGTLLGAVRHNGFIPWDDDMDIAMFRQDYEKFIKIAKKELPSNIKLWKCYWGFSKLMNIKTTALGDYNRKNKEFMGGIDIDIFPMDYSSKYWIINRTKSKVLYYIKSIIHLKESGWTGYKVKKGKKFFLPIVKYVFNKIELSELMEIYNKINKKVFFKGKKVYSPFNTLRFFPENIYSKSKFVKFENTTICIPNLYDIWLKMSYGDYMKPIIYQGGHNRWYSVDKPYNYIIKSFKECESNEENYKNNNYLFLL